MLLLFIGHIDIIMAAEIRQKMNKFIIRGMRYPDELTNAVISSIL